MTEKIGEVESKTSILEKKINDLVEGTNSVLDNNHIFQVRVDPDLVTALDVDKITLQKMNPEDIGESAVLLKKYAYYVQVFYNKEHTKFKFLKEALNRIIGREIPNYKSAYSNFEETKLKIIAGNDAAREYNTMLIFQEGRLERIQGLAMRIQDMAYSLIELQKTKTFMARGRQQ